MHKGQSEMSRSGRSNKRSKNPGGVDNWLDILGYYRKNVAYDETCMFRAVSEQLFHTQVNHEDIRNKCIYYGKYNSKEFRHLVPKKKDWLERLKNLELHMLVCNEIEIEIICKAYEVDIKVFNSHDREISEFKYHDVYVGSQTLHLCKTNEDHYDAVYTKDHINVAGFCQSIVYKVLYEDVFGISNIDSIVHSMLHDKQGPFITYYPEVSQSRGTNSEEEDSLTDYLNPPTQQNVIAPFPFKIAKALDPNMYRNIEYDTWLELRRELRLGQWYYGDDKLILGTRCLLTRNNENYQCYIQSILEDENLCEVYITKLAERITVSYDDLRPEDDAKPWPLPYRFARNQTLPLPSPSSVLPLENERKPLHKRKEKKRLQSLGEDSTHSESKDGFGDFTITNFEGIPLLMQGASEVTPFERLTLTLPMSSCESDSREEANLMSVPWSESLNTSHENFSDYSSKFTTPSAEPMQCHDLNGNQVVYNYESESVYSPVQMYAAQSPYMISPDSVLSEANISPAVDYRSNTSKYVFYHTDSAYGSPTYIPSPLPCQSIPFSPNAVNTNDRVLYTTPTPATTPMDMYPVVYPVPSPGTPIYYPPPLSAPASTPTYPVSPLPIYSPPPLEMQYVSSPAYIYPPLYPPAPPLAWYNPSHVNAQGFIFPPPVNNTSA